MDLLGVSEDDEECAMLFIEEQIGACLIKDMYYCAEKQAIVVFLIDDSVVPNLLPQSQCFVVEGKSYRARRLYTADLLDVGNAELAVLYLDTLIGQVVYNKHFADEQRLLVAFDDAKASEKLCDKEIHVIEEGVAFRIKQVSKPLQENVPQASQQVQPHLVQQHGQSPQLGEEVPQWNWQQDCQLRHQPPQPKGHEEQQRPEHRATQLEQQQQQQHQWASQVHDKGNDFQTEHSVIISDVPETMSKSALELELTKQWKKMSIIPSRVDYNPSTRMAVVSFSYADDVRKVLEDGQNGGISWSVKAWDGRQTVCDLLGDIALLVENVSPEFSTEALWCYMKMFVGHFAHTIMYSSSSDAAAVIFAYFNDLNIDVITSHTKMHSVAGRRLHVTATRYTKKAQALDLSEQVSVDILQKHLEDPQNGGKQGCVARIERIDLCTADITFSTDNALNRALSQKHQLFDREVLLVPFFEEVGTVTSSRLVYKFSQMKRALKDADALPIMPIELTLSGFDIKQLDESALRQFLSQRRMSGGGDIQSFSCSKGKAVVTFMDSDCATRVYQKYQCEGLVLCGCRLVASICTFDISDDAHNDQVLLRNIGVASDDSLKYWLWGILDNPVHRIDFVTRNDDQELCAIAHFERDVDFRRLACSLKAVTLDGLLVEPDVVYRPRSVVVTNVPCGTHPDLVNLCFGNFGSVQEVSPKTPQQWLVTYCHSADATRACLEKVVFRDSVELQINFYTECHVHLNARETGRRGLLALSLTFCDTAVVDFVMTKRKEDFENLLQHFESTVSTEKRQKAPTVVCLLSSSDPRYRDVAQRWPTLKDACLVLFAPFRSRSIPVSASIYEAIVGSESYLHMTNQSKLDLLVTSRQQHDQPFHEILLVGTPLATEDAYAAMQAIVRDTSNSLERSKRRIVHVCDRQSESATKLLDSIGFCRAVKERYEELSADLDRDNQVFRFEGLPGDVAAATEDMQCILKSSHEDTVKGSVAMLELLGKDEVRKFIDEQLKQKNLHDKVAWYLKPSAGVCVRGVDVQSAGDAATILRTQIVDMPITVDVDSLQLIASPSWESFSNDIFKKYCDNVVLKKPEIDSNKSGAVVRLSCKVTDSERIVEEVQEFLKRHTLKETVIGLPCMTAELITTFMQDSVIRHIEKMQSRNFVKLHPLGDSASGSAKSGLRVIGNLDGLANARRILAGLLKTNAISVKRHTIIAPGAEKHFKSEDKVLSRIASETKTIIRVHIGTEDDTELRLDESGLMAASHVILPCGTELHVLKGDIVQLSCDAIVNPANGQLQHLAGLARVIAEKGGQIINDECADFITDHGQLLDGQVCVTAAGALPCKKIIHAVGPQWQGGTRNEESKLFNAVQSLLAAAVQHGLNSLAIPPISSGVFSYPIDKCAKVIVESVIDFCKCSKKRLKKIILVDNKSDGVQNFKKVVDQLASKTGDAAAAAAEAAPPGAASLSVTAFMPTIRLSRGDTASVRKINQLDAASGPQGTAHVSLPCGTELHVLKSDISQLSCDSIVNPANAQLQLTGGLSAVIANKGGQIIVDECAAIIRDRGQLSDGQVCVTTAGALPCKKIIHAVGPQWQGGTRNEENTLFSAVQNSLAAAVQLGLSSVAIPPISSGVLGYPMEKCAQVIVKSVLDFCNCATKCMKKIILVDNKSDGVRSFRIAVNQLANSTALRAPTGFSQFPVDYPKPHPNADESVQTAQAVAQRPLTVGNTAVELIQGSLVDQQVDAMVNTVGPLLLLNQGVLSSSVGTAAGPAMQLHLTTNYPGGISYGELAVSDGFQLQCRSVLHCCFSHWSSDNADQEACDLLLTCLTEAERLGMSSIAIPAIGSGRLGFPPQESARVAYEAVLLYFRDRPGSSIRHIKLVVHSPPSVVLAYHAQHAAILRGEGTFAPLKLSRTAKLARGRGKAASGSTAPRQSEVMPSPLVVNICGTEDGIKIAIKALEEYCRKNIVEYSVLVHEDACKMLVGSQLDDLVQQGLDAGVSIEVDRRNSKVVIRSLDRPAAISLQTQVGNIVTLQRMERLQEEAVSNRCQWQFRVGKNRWRDYDASLNAKLEQAHRKREKTVCYTSADGEKYIVDFAIMKDYVEGNAENGVEMQRVGRE